jgi:predicted DNA-binding transcriptional regulator YafY
MAEWVNYEHPRFIMRADRLISLLMLLQTRGSMTAQELSRELEVSERTIYRDIEALGASGVPVYAESGPGGGCSLLDSYRTTLTGLNQDEVRALFTVCASVPAPLAKLGVARHLNDAMLKLSAALQNDRRAGEADGVRQRLYLDSTPWFVTDEPTPCLQTIHRAVWEDRKLQLVRRIHFAGFIDTMMDHTVEPLGLVAKASVWHLVCASAGQVHVWRASQIVTAQMLDDHFQRPVGFNLGAFWTGWREAYECNRPQYKVMVRVAPQGIQVVAKYRSTRGPAASAPDGMGWVTLVHQYS